MTDEDKLSRDSTRGTHAEALLRDDLLKETFVTLRLQYTEEWAKTEPHERERREFFWRAVQVLVDVENHIKKVAMDGRLAKAELAAKRA